MPLPKNVILVHGYSVRSLDTYGLLPQRLQDDGINPQHLILSAYDSLNDDITCDDLALALEAKIQRLGPDMSSTAIVAHSTGAIVVRRWLLNRRSAQLPLPTHFVSLAGAHHGSSLAQLGQTQLAHFFRQVFDGTSVGAEVLQDLDYGSEFLLKLNEEWLDAYLAPNPPGTYCFGLIGDDHSDLQNQIFWQSCENGSDCTVRISGGNLNYRILTFDQTSPHPGLTTKHLPTAVPHLVLTGISHTGQKGILGGNATAMNQVYPRIWQALNVGTAEDYRAVHDDWAALTDEWSKKNPDHCNATIVFSLRHPGGRNIKDSLILIKDSNTKNAGDETLSILAVKGSLESRQPIQNNTTPSSVSFYVNYQKFIATYPHQVEISINSGSDEISYPPAVYEVQADQTESIRPNESVYVKVTLNRRADGTYSLIPADQTPDRTRKWPPLPQPRA